MDPRSTPGLMMAPGASTAALRAPGREEPLPPVDAITLKEDSGREILDGYVVEVMSSEEPHATLHSQIDRVLGPCVGDAYQVAVDMLTRTGQRNEFAPDVSVFPKERDPTTGGRKVEELAFEVIDSTRLAEITDKARKLVARGVRRVFVIDVNARTVSEWSSAADAWQAMTNRASVNDRCLAAPVPVKALLDAAEAEWAIVRGMKARKAPALLKEIAEGEERGRLEGQIEALLRVCARRGLALTDAQVTTVRACADATTLERWLDRAIFSTTSDAVFTDEGRG